MLKSAIYNYWRDANNYQQEKTHLFFFKDNSLFRAVFSYSEQIFGENITNSTFTIDLKRKYKKKSKNYN